MRMSTQTFEDDRYIHGFDWGDDYTYVYVYIYTYTYM
jgi:hypothetical protein